MIEGSLILPILVIIILILVSAFFSGSETGLTGVSRAKIHRLGSDGNRRAKQVSFLRHNKEKLLGTILFGNNAVNIAASALATAVSIHYFGDSGVVYATIVMTLLVLIFAEMMPKTYAFRNTERVALAVAPIFVPLVKILSPVTRALQLSIEFFMKMIGVKHKSEEKISTTEALRGAIELHHDAGVVVKDDRYMLDSILDLQETEVGEIMIHRKQMETIDIGQKPSEIIDQILKSPHTRIPFWEGVPDNIVGVMHAKDLLRATQAHDGDIKTVDLYSLLMDSWFIPETTSLKDQLQAFMEKKNHFALVVDEYGGLQGLVTLEDILEEIVGQIEDEYDTKEHHAPHINQEKEGLYIVDGAMTIRDLNRELDWELPDEEAATIAGLVIHEAQNIPDKGQVFQFHDRRFEILAKQKNQITKIRVSKMEEPEEG